MSKNLSLFTIMLLLVFSGAIAQSKNSIKQKQSDQFKPAIDLIMEAFRNKKSDKLSKILIPGYTINGIPKGLESQVLPQIFEQMPSFSKYIITELKTEKGNQRVWVTFIFKEQKLEANLLFDKQQKIKEMNILEGATVN